ncbi:MAG: tRNA pseudouridine32 synthase/23S rRNA pseudouridine746 synthase, partial [bacterium]
MTSILSKTTDHYFTSFSSEIGGIPLPKKFTNPFAYKPHPLAILACDEVKAFLTNQTSIDHNFGLRPEQKGKAIGKMFGVLVAQNQKGEVGYLTGFSGKIA